MPRARSCLSTMRARAAAYGSTSPGAWFLSWPPGRITVRGYAATRRAGSRPVGRRRELPAGEGWLRRYGAGVTLAAGVAAGAADADGAGVALGAGVTDGAAAPSLRSRARHRGRGRRGARRRRGRDHRDRCRCRHRREEAALPEEQRVQEDQPEDDRDRDHEDLRDAVVDVDGALRRGLRVLGFGGCPAPEPTAGTRSAGSGRRRGRRCRGTGLIGRDAWFLVEWLVAPRRRRLRRRRCVVALVARVVLDIVDAVSSVSSSSASASGAPPRRRPRARVSPRARARRDRSSSRRHSLVPPEGRRARGAILPATALRPGSVPEARPAMRAHATGPADVGELVRPRAAAGSAARPARPPRSAGRRSRTPSLGPAPRS